MSHAAALRMVEAPEPGRLPAAVLALVVHAAFFALLFFGVSWQTTKPPEPVTADLWAELPPLPKPPPAPRVEPRPTPPPPPPPPRPTPKVETPPPPPKPAPAPEPQPAKPDIALKAEQEAKKREEIKKAEEVKKQQEIRKAEEEKKKAEEARVREEQMQALLKQQEAAAREAEAAEALRRQQKEQADAQAKLLNDYKAKIQSKVRRLIVLPPDVPAGIEAQMEVVLLPGGEVLGVKLSKASGHSAYDQAVERAIYKAQPLPLPPDPKLFQHFRELKLKFKPE